MPKDDIWGNRTSPEWTLAQEQVYSLEMEQKFIDTSGRVAELEDMLRRVLECVPGTGHSVLEEAAAMLNNDAT